MTSDETAARTVTVDLEALCTLYETAERLGLYMGTPQWDAAMAMPPEVVDRLRERANERTERLLAAAQASVAHREGRPHDESVCIDCALYGEQR